MKKILQFGLLGLLLLVGWFTWGLFDLSRQYQKTTHSPELDAISCETLVQWEDRIMADIKAAHEALLAGMQAEQEAGKSNSQGQKEVILSDEVLEAMKQKQQLFLEMSDYYARVRRCLVEGQSIGFDFGIGRTLQMPRALTDSWHRLAKKWIFQKADFEENLFELKNSSNRG